MMTMMMMVHNYNKAYLQVWCHQFSGPRTLCHCFRRRSPRPVFFAGSKRGDDGGDDDGDDGDDNVHPNFLKKRRTTHANTEHLESVFNLKVRVRAGSRSVLECGAGGDEPIRWLSYCIAVIIVIMIIIIVIIGHCDLHDTAILCSPYESVRFHWRRNQTLLERQESSRLVVRMSWIFLCQGLWWFFCQWLWCFFVMIMVMTSIIGWVVLRQFKGEKSADLGQRLLPMWGLQPFRKRQ